MRKKAHQVNEKLQELSKENGKDDNDELRNIAARFNRMDATLQLEQDTRSLETAQLESRVAEEAKDEEAAKNTGEIRRCFETPGDHDVWETLPEQRSEQCSLPGGNGPWLIMRNR